MKPRQRFCINRSYVQAVIEAGGIPVLLAGGGDSAGIRQQLELLDGLLLTGGMDHDPKLYGSKKHPKTDTLHSIRQEYEIEIAKLAMKTDFPILGVCLGCQTLNIVNGGTLIQDIPSQVKTNIAHSQKEGRSAQTHDVHIEKNSRLFRILKKGKIKTNSFHHQALGKVGKKFKIVGRASDNIIEAIEYQNNRFVLGVQWHPEELTGYETHRALFKALVNEAKKEDEPHPLLDKEKGRG